MWHNNDGTSGESFEDWNRKNGSMLVLNIPSMSDGNVCDEIENCISSLNGIKKVLVSLDTRTVSIKYDTLEITRHDIYRKLKQSGYIANINLTDLTQNKYKIHYFQDILFDTFLLNSSFETQIQSTFWYVEF